MLHAVWMQTDDGVADGLADENPTVCIAVVRGLQQLIQVCSSSSQWHMRTDALMGQVGKQTRKVLLPFMKKLLPCLRRLLLKQSCECFAPVQ